MTNGRIGGTPLEVLDRGRMSLGLIERVRLILRGGSIVDWHRLDLRTEEEVRSLLQVNGYDLDDPEDCRRLRRLYRMAADYLDEGLGCTVPNALADPQDVVDPFLVASEMASPDQRSACILLKVVHTFNHYEARELRLSLALSELEVFSLVEQRICHEIARMQAAGVPVVHFEGSRKTRTSTITKLLSKRRATAAQILDRVRFRILVRTHDDIPPVLAELTRRLIPYNYVVPGETTNEIVDFRRYFDSLPQLREVRDQLQFGLDLEELHPLHPAPNECSADAFRMLNFVVDFPVRIGPIMSRPENAQLRHLGRIVFINVELQVFDQATWDANERSSEASHGAYKERQRLRVQRRLQVGLDLATFGRPDVAD